ncbi:MAG: immunity 17 family protein [Oscillospiraceae bacterium]|nr:immunity 17 family protein [Oscillospiraceae bacterium]
MVSSLFTIAGGIFCVWASYTRKEWFFRSSKAWLFVKLFGEEGARIFYIILGVFLIIVGLLLLGRC